MARYRGTEIGQAKRQRIIAIYHGRCAICGAKPPKLTMDHIKRREDGGSHEESNLASACPRCNTLRDKAMQGSREARRKLLRRRLACRHLFAHLVVAAD
jgi:5-methylcytosine-specific restriction endonuclease McrA